ncbi:hypothetical protein JCGZ_03445 [Jatropha curcas]|uniref:RING-type E3 ubiquitin transferase n=1 Tax=Jatropha curcas TaxID=180498 RepID=A0A067L729_JATCU|nr:putative RING-H2 finger protein ATL21A [Jatropha curcas]KDP39914.1 hypothetical protein JCGZ_03445 [Jatropha curcas]
MNTSVFYILFFSSIFLSIDSFQVNCSDSAPDIHFPFWISNQHPQHCNNHPAFELSCKENTTMIYFPCYGDLGVKSISYDIKKIDLFDPKNCVHQVFLNLNLSQTPFRYYYLVKDYTYLNCSTTLSPSFVEIPCLSGSKHHVYTVDSSFSVPVSCRVVKTVAVPFAYSPFLADNSFGLGLTWSLPGDDYKGFSIKKSILGDIYGQLLQILLCILAAMVLVGIKIYHSKKQNTQIDDESLLVLGVRGHCKIQENREWLTDTLSMTKLNLN